MVRNEPHLSRVTPPQFNTYLLTQRSPAMTELFEKAFTLVSKLSDPEQDSFARWLLSELESERKGNGMIFLAVLKTC